MNIQSMLRGIGYIFLAIFFIIITASMAIYIQNNLQKYLFKDEGTKNLQETENVKTRSNNINHEKQIKEVLGDLELLKNELQNVKDSLKKLEEQQNLRRGTGKEENQGQENKTGKYRLTVNATPSDSIIKIINIKQIYEPGIVLLPGKYKIQVSKDGYQSKEFLIQIINTDITTSVELVKK